MSEFEKAYKSYQLLAAADREAVNNLVLQLPPNRTATPITDIPRELERAIDLCESLGFVWAGGGQRASLTLAGTSLRAKLEE